ncbi:MAG: hypothetical protein ACREF4_23370, partial [Gammaproteobacteria bacterium]
MNIDFDAIVRLHKSGRFAELLTSCPPLNNKGTVSGNLRVMLAEASLFYGDLDTARMLAAPDVGQPQDKSIRPRLEVVLGLASKDAGDFESAARHVHLAVRLASEIGEPCQIAWCELNRFRLLINGGPESQLVGNLASVRRCVTRAGDPHLTA